MAFLESLNFNKMGWIHIYSMVNFTAISRFHETFIVFENWWSIPWKQGKQKIRNSTHLWFAMNVFYLERSSIYDWLELFRKLGHETLPCRRRELYYSAMFHLTREKLSVKGLTLPILSRKYGFCKKLLLYDWTSEQLNTLFSSKSPI